MRRTALSGLITVGCAAVCGLLAGPAVQAAQAASAPASAQAEGVVRAPDITADPSPITGISADSSKDAWAAGQQLLHWNGKTWSKAADPVSTAMLQAVKALSPGNAWAVGTYCPVSSCATFDPLILHWNGKTWSKVASPAIQGELYGIDAVSATNVWAVGQSKGKSTTSTLIEHWNGKAWSKTASPSPGTLDGLRAVSVVSATNAWAVGGYDTTSFQLDTLILHWNGKT